MNKTLNLLFVSDYFGTRSSFQTCLELEGCRVTVAVNSEDATRMLLFPAVIDAVLIHDDNVARGIGLASGLKLISPRTPVLMVSSQWPGKAMDPSGPDALFHTASLDWRAASDLANFIRHLIAEKSLHLVGETNYGPRPFAPRRPSYLN